MRRRGCGQTAAGGCSGMETTQATAGPAQSFGARLLDRLVGASLAGTGAASRATLTVLVLVLTLDWADRNVLGGVAPELRRDLGISNTQLGLLATSFSIVGALATVPVGVLVDRSRRLLLLGGAAVAWSLAMLATGSAQGFAWLFGARLLLGALAATTGPVTPSVVGDLVPERLRARVLALVGSGQLVGTGLGYVVAAAVVAVLDWRWAFWMLAVPGFVLAFVLIRLPEPTRTSPATLAEDGSSDSTAELTLWQATRVVLSIRTNVVVLVAAAVGSLFFAAVGTFAVVFATEQYSISTSEADLGVIALAVGALGGMFGGGRLGDWLVSRGYPTGRLWVASVGLVLATVFGIPALFTTSLVLAAVSVTLAVAALNAATPTLDAVRLDVVPPALRGRAESLRTVTRTMAEGLAPLLIGVLSDHLGGGGHAGLRLAFVIVLPALALNGLLLLLARNSYPRETAAATAPAPPSDDQSDAIAQSP
jgi:MFS family permease